MGLGISCTRLHIQGKNSGLSSKLAHLFSDVADVYSTIGAGDTFIAGMLYCLLYQGGWDLSKKLTFANRVAGMKVTQEGFSNLERALKLYP